MKLVIQMPALNEEEMLPRALAALPRSVPGFSQVTILVIDDGSTDRTAEVARLGLVPADMPRVADLLGRAGLKRERVGREVLLWRKQFQGLRYA